LYLTHILKAFDCDIFFPEVPVDFKKIDESKIQEENNIKFKFTVYER
jgi:dihydrofolate reductase